MWHIDQFCDYVTTKKHVLKLFSVKHSTLSKKHHNYNCWGQESNLYAKVQKIWKVWIRAPFSKVKQTACVRFRSRMISTAAHRDKSMWFNFWAIHTVITAVRHSAKLHLRNKSVRQIWHIHNDLNYRMWIREKRKDCVDGFNLQVRRQKPAWEIQGIAIFVHNTFNPVGITSVLRLQSGYGSAVYGIWRPLHNVKHMSPKT